MTDDVAAGDLRQHTDGFVIVFDERIGIAREVITAYDPNLYYGVPRMIPIEDIIEAQGITLEYQCLRKTGCVLGETIFEDIPSLRSRAAPYSSIAPSAERMPPQADCALPALMSWHTGCCIRDCTAEPARVLP